MFAPKYSLVMVTKSKGRCDVHMPIPSAINDSIPDCYLLLDHPFDGSARFFTSHVETADQVQQIVGQEPHLQPGFFCREAVAACSRGRQSTGSTRTQFESREAAAAADCAAIATTPSGFVESGEAHDCGLTPAATCCRRFRD